MGPKELPLRQLLCRDVDAVRGADQRRLGGVSRLIIRQLSCFLICHGKVTFFDEFPVSFLQEVHNKVQRC